MKIKSPQDFWAGLMFIAFGLFFVVVALLYYQMGSSVRMGPAYFPVMLGGLLAVLGAIVLVNALVLEGPAVAKFHFRPVLFIAISSLAFAYLLKPLGMPLAGVALVFISAYGGHEFKWKEVAIMSVVLVIFSVLVFVEALVLPFPICPSFIDNCPIR
ncbi:MAG TPA: tripartite tricarboxylate transporter TctB family protein [Burkholderiales bacterium]|nr:tripartite tricarboxylate transporter TctB family protein [Burkholderiales bacterium]